jgi:hypothetical protein
LEGENMKKKIAVIAILLCFVSVSPVLARGYHGNYNDNYYGRSNHYGHHGSGHHRNGLGIAVGVVGGLLLGSALISAANPQPSTVVYGYPSVTYRQPVVVERPRVCVEERIVNGEWQVSRYDGSQVWVSFPYPVTQNVQVPCY